MPVLREVSQWGCSGVGRAGRGRRRSRPAVAVAALALGLGAGVWVTPTGAEADSGAAYSLGFFMEWGYDIEVGPDGSAYITGSTGRAFEATPGAFDETANGGADAFVARIDPTGRVVYATFLGGSYSDTGATIAVDEEGAAYVGGDTSSRDFPTTPQALDDHYVGVENTAGFLAKVSPDGSSVEYSTRLPGVRYVHDVAVDDAGAAHLTGEAFPGFPTTEGAFDLVGDPDDAEGFLATVDPSGSRLLQASFLGGSDTEFARRVELGADGSRYVGGYTWSADYPTTPGAFDTSFGGRFDAFVTKVAPSGKQLEWSTLVGGSQPFDAEEDLVGVALRRDGSVYLTGHSDATDFPTTPGALYPEQPGHPDGDSWVARLDATGSQLEFATFMPANLFEAHSDRGGDVHITGVNPLAGFPVAGESHGAAVALELDGRGELVQASSLTGQYPWDFDVDPAGTLYVLGPALASEPVGARTAARSAYRETVADARGFVGRYARCTVTGTSGADVLRGTPGPDVICGLGGADVVEGRGGYDVLRLGPGDDRVDGGTGIDILVGGAGVDVLEGAGARDLLLGGDQADHLVGGDGADTLLGQAGADRLGGLAGADQVYAGAGADVGYGGLGRDVVGGGPGRDRLYGGDARDVVRGGLGADLLDGGAARDRCRGGDGVDRMLRCP